VDEIEYLALKAKNDDKALQELFKLLSNDIKKMLSSSQLFIAGSDDSDLIQESRIALWKAVNDFKPEAGMSFKNFSINVVIRRHIITTVSHANRKKFIVHNSAASLDTPISHDYDEATLSDIIQDHTYDMQSDYADREAFYKHRFALIEHLTKLEINVLDLYIQHYSYKEISKELKVKMKAVDNSLSRVRAKAQLLDIINTQDGEQVHNDIQIDDISE